MAKYIIKRLLQTIIVLVGVTLVTFIMLNVAPGDPVYNMLQKRATPEMVAAVRHQLGLDVPLPQQYLNFVGGALKGNLGSSYFNKVPVLELIDKAFPITLKLSALALLISVIVGITVGTVTAVFRGKIIDQIIMLFTMLSISAPIFWFAIIMQIVLGLQLKIFPISGMERQFWMVMPVAVLGLRYGASASRMVRTNMIDALSQDYVRTARAKGVNEFFVVMKHVLKNAGIPVITMVGSQLRDLLGGAMVIEIVFGIKGIGKVAIDAINSRDIPVIQGITLYMAVVYVAINLVVDMFYGVLDPRIRIVGGER